MSSPALVVQTIETAQGLAYIIDLNPDDDNDGANNISEKVLRWIDDFRMSLPLDSKRPTVQRRFFADGITQSTATTIIHSSTRLSREAMIQQNIDDWDSTRPIAHWIESMILRNAVVNSSLSSFDTATTAKTGATDSSHVTSERCCCSSFHVFRYQRFLEYTQKGSQLTTHTDGTKICEETGRQSTHTLLLYLTDCPIGGETLLLLSRNGDEGKEHWQHEEEGRRKSTGTEEPHYHAVHPKRGRILIFPHATPHAGAPVVVTPKICLRAEVAIDYHSIHP